jgi:hypothetical protein
MRNLLGRDLCYTGRAQNGSQAQPSNGRVRVANEAQARKIASGGAPPELLDLCAEALTTSGLCPVPPA